MFYDYVRSRPPAPSLLSRPSFIHSSVHFTPQKDSPESGASHPDTNVHPQKVCEGLSAVLLFSRSSVEISRGVFEAFFFFSRSFEKQADVLQSRCPVCKIKRSKTVWRHIITVSLQRFNEPLQSRTLPSHSFIWDTWSQIQRLLLSQKNGSRLEGFFRLTSWNFIFPKVKRRHDLSG